MDTKAVTAEVRLRHWADQMKERQASGLSIRRWCNEQGIAEKTYYYWQRKLRTEMCKNLTQPETALAPIGWARLTENEPDKAANSSLIIEIGNYRIKVDDNTDPGLLAKVCGVLASVC